MLDFLYRASFFLYEISFTFFALALALCGWSMFRINRALRQPAFWILPGLSSFLLLACAYIHFYVYHRISPQYLLTASRDLLIQMYVLKTISMFAILAAGIGLIISSGLFLRQARR
jgi:hypothetical protein